MLSKKKKKHTIYKSNSTYNNFHLYFTPNKKKNFNTGEWNSGLQIWRKRIKKIQDKLGQKRLTEGREKEKKKVNIKEDGDENKGLQGQQKEN